MPEARPSQSATATKDCRGIHDEMPNGRCFNCGALANGMLLDQEPVDFPRALTELRAVHDLIKAEGLQQDSDGQWGCVTGYWEPEWDETGNTVDALRELLQRQWGIGLYELGPSMMHDDGLAGAVHACGTGDLDAPWNTDALVKLAKLVRQRLDDAKREVERRRNAR